MPTRMPVKEPGPVVTAKRSTAAKSEPASAMTSPIRPNSRSAWPRPMRFGTDDRLRRVADGEPDRTGLKRGVDAENDHSRAYGGKPAAPVNPAEWP